ncbi:MAG TPA: peptide ABC transporter substrate-binding protein [Thermomicrobiales bacterium]|nr:peptide ABC transporter substrate-binding protein [Thermomicrobiales bacterium]
MRRSSQKPVFAQLVEASKVPHSRRDFMRVSAILAGAAATGIHAVTAAPGSSSRPSSFAQDDIDTDVELVLPFNPYGQPITVDPHRTVNWGPFWVLLPYAWSGLLRFDENGKVEPDLAESVEPNDDGSVWTAKLKDGIAYADGDPILADHFLASWQRALDHMRLSPMASFMADVQGYDDYVAGAAQDELGFKAVDDQTVEITLSRPVSHFPSSLATFVWAVMNPAYIDADPDTEPDLSGASAGPWKIAEFDDASHILMQPNEHYWDDPSPSITGIRWSILPGAGTDQAALDLYRSGDIAIADVPITLLEEVQGDDDLNADLVEIQDHSSTLAISMDFNQPPFNDVQVRRAISAGIDRETWATDIQQGAFVPATSFTPPVLKTIANYEAPEGLNLTAKDAKKLLKDAKIDPDELETGVTYFQPATDSTDDMDRAQKLLDMIAAGTGIEITHDTSLTREQITALRQDNGGLQFDIVQWWLASETPSILELVASQDSAYNVGWTNWTPDLEKSGDFTPGDDATTFNDLVTKADATLDEETRNASYKQAEGLFLKNAVYVPLGYWVQRYVQHPWLQGTRQGPWSGSTPVRVDKDVTVSGKPESTPTA